MIYRVSTAHTLLHTHKHVTQGLAWYSAVTSRCGECSIFGCNLNLLGHVLMCPLSTSCTKPLIVYIKFKLLACMQTILSLEKVDS